MRDVLDLLARTTRVPGSNPVVAAVLQEFGVGLLRAADDDALIDHAPRSYHGTPCRPPTRTS